MIIANEAAEHLMMTLALSSTTAVSAKDLIRIKSCCATRSSLAHHETLTGNLFLKTENIEPLNIRTIKIKKFAAISVNIFDQILNKFSSPDILRNIFVDFQPVKEFHTKKKFCICKKVSV